MIKHRLEELGLEQRDLAAAAEVTDSYISQLLNRKKLPPAPDRTDIYAEMDRFLKLPRGKLSTLAEHQRKEELKRHLAGPPAPLYKEVRELILRKCATTNSRKSASFWKGSPLVNWSALSRRSSWMSSSKWLGKNWKVKIWCIWWLG